MAEQIADRYKPSRQLKVNADGSIDSNALNDGLVVSSVNPLPVSMDSDIQIGAVELKDGATDTRAKVKSDGIDNSLVVLENPRKDMEGGGKISVGTTAIEATFTGTPTHSVIIRADRNNTGLLYIGESNVTQNGTSSLTYLEAGDSITIDYDDTDNAVYVVSDTASQNFWKGALL